MTSPADNLGADLDHLALRTWQRVHLGPQFGLTLREDGITDENLFRLRLAHPYLNVRKFSSVDEAVNGADWEWWLGSDAAGWVGLRIQAKKMVRMRYAELQYRSERQTRIQCQVLVEETQAAAAGRALFPLYCFYNGWDETHGWPADVPWTVGCSQPANCQVVPDVRVFGCGLAAATQVLDVLENVPDPLGAAQTLPLQTPWSWILNGGPHGTLAMDGHILDRIATALRFDDEDRQKPRYESLPGYAQATREGWPAGEIEQIAVPTTYVVTTDLGEPPVTDLR